LRGCPSCSRLDIAGVGTANDADGYVQATGKLGGGSLAPVGNDDMVRRYRAPYAAASALVHGDKIGAARRI